MVGAGWRFLSLLSILVSTLYTYEELRISYTHWDVVKGVGVDRVGGNCPLFVVLCLFARSFYFSLFFSLCLCAGTDNCILPPQKGAFHSDPVCTDPVQNFPNPCQGTKKYTPPPWRPSFFLFPGLRLYGVYSSFRTYGVYPFPLFSQENGIHHSFFCSVSVGSGDRPRKEGSHGGGIYSPESPRPQIWGVEISPPKFRARTSKNTLKQVIFEDSPPKFGG